MSVAGSERRLTVRHFRKGGGPYVCLTAYTAPIARLLDPHADLLLVGNSLGMVLYGLETTVPVTLEMMIAHGGAVVRGAGTPASSSTCRSAATRNRRNRPSAPPRACWPKPAAPPSSSKAAPKWRRRSASSPRAACRCAAMSG